MEKQRYEKRIKDTILHFVANVKKREVYKVAKKLSDILISFKKEIATIDPILEKWVARKNRLKSFFDFLVDQSIVDIQLTNTYKFVKDLFEFEVNRESLKRKERY